MRDLDFAYFFCKAYCYIFLMFYIYLFCRDVFMWTGILGLYFVWQNAVKSKLFNGLHETKLSV